MGQQRPWPGCRDRCQSGGGCLEETQSTNWKNEQDLGGEQERRGYSRQQERHVQRSCGRREPGAEEGLLMHLMVRKGGTKVVLC